MRSPLLPLLLIALLLSTDLRYTVWVDWAVFVIALANLFRYLQTRWRRGRTDRSR